MPKSRCDGGRPVMSRPPCRMRPPVAGSSPAIARSSVVLPQPDGPRKETNSPAATARLTPPSASKLPKRFDTRSTTR